MTDAPFTETHRATLCELATGWMSGRFPDAIDAALSEIDRLRQNLQSIADSSCCGCCQEAALFARAALRNEPVKEGPL